MSARPVSARPVSARTDASSPALASAPSALRFLDVMLELSEDAARDLEARAAAVGVSPQILASAYVLFMLGYHPDGARLSQSMGGTAGLDVLDVMAARRAYPDNEPGKPLPPPAW